MDENRSLAVITSDAPASPAVRVLSSKMVIAKKGGLCAECSEEIFPQTRVTAIVVVTGKKISRVRSHVDCDNRMIARISTAPFWAPYGLVNGSLTEMFEG